jgi:YebC/PmpR family DNA-binding regulatory protein
MAGHSKWSKIKRKKGANDAKRGQLFTRLLKEIQIAAKSGGDPNGNPRLRATIQTAKSQGVPADNIDRAIKRGTGDLEGVDYMEVLYEGYGPGGVAFLIKALTDNKTRTVAEVRYALSRNGGSLAASNAVAYMFTECGIFTIGVDKVSEEELFDVMLEAGATDIRRDAENWEVITDLKGYNAVYLAFDKLGKEFEAALKYVPESNVGVNGDQAESLFKLIDALDDIDDVQDVTANFDIDDSELERLGMA